MTSARWLQRDKYAQLGPHLLLCTEKEQLHKALRHMGRNSPLGADWPEDGAVVHSFTRGSGGLVCIVCVSQDAQDHAKDNPHETMGLLVHEASHVVDAYLDVMGERKPGGEQRAYALQRVFMLLLSEYGRQTEEREARALKDHRRAIDERTDP